MSLAKRIGFLLVLTASPGVANLQAQTPAFPGAVGFGANATGGRGGTVYHVTTLADSGAGSFRTAVSSPNRIVVFDVGGYITLTTEVGVKNNITIAGQTAPGGGIGIKGAEVTFGSSSNVICRHVRLRPGSSAVSTANGINLNNATNMIFDQVSVEFAPWNNIDGVGCRDITFQRCLIADPIGQQFCAHLEQLGANCAWYQNIFANAHNRQPLSKINTIYINNIVYNYQAGYTCGDTSGSFTHDIINNYFITGPATTSPGNDFFQIGGNQSIYDSGNLRDSDNDGVLNGSATSPGEGTALGAPWSGLTPGIPTVSAAWAFRQNISASGASPRDQVDSVIMNEIRSVGVAGPYPLPTSQNVTGLGNNGFGTINGAAVPIDTDQDGMPDYWEIATGSNPGSDDAMNIGTDGYARLESYLNWLAEPHALTTTNTSVDVDLWLYTTGFTNASPIYSVTALSNCVVTLTNSHLAHLTPNPAFTGLASFQFSVVASDGSALTNVVTAVVTSLPTPSNLIWHGDGVANVWSVGGDTNWFNGTDLVAFNSGDNVTFDDTGSNNPAINLASSISAGTVYVLADQDYTFGGSGALVGPTSLLKVGSGKLTMNNLNTFSGGTTINEGTVQLGDGVSVNGSLSGNITNKDTLIFANPIALATSASISGSGTLTKSGAGTLTLTGVQTYTNLTTIEAGVLEFSGTPPPGSVTNNGTLTFKPSGVITYAGSINGSGAVTMNASGQTLILTGSNSYDGGFTNTAGNVIFGNSTAQGTGPVIYTAGSVMVGGSAVITNDFSIPGSATIDLCMQATNGTGVWAGNIVNLGSAAQWRPGADTGGTFIFTGTAIQGSHNFIVPRGSVQFASNALVSASGTATALGRDSGANNRSANISLRDNATMTLGLCSMGGGQAGGSVTLTIQNNASLSTAANNFDLHNVNRSTALNTIRLNGGSFTVGGFTKTRTFTNLFNFNGGWLRAGANNSSFLPVFANQTIVVQAGGAKIDDSGFSITIAAPLVHDAALGAALDGGLTKQGNGFLFLSGTNTYTGPTIILGGRLDPVSNGSIAASSGIQVGPSAGFSVANLASGSMTLGSGRTLSGSGSVFGSFTIGSGAILAPGSNSIDTLTFSVGTPPLTLATGCTNILEISHSPLTNDVIKVLGSVSLGGALLVTNIGSSLAAGDTFKLIDASGYNNSFSTVMLPTLDPGLAWDTSSLNTAGVISVITVSPLSIAGAQIIAGNFIFNGSGGASGGDYYVLSSTNLALPWDQWTPLLTNQFDPGGNFSVTNAIDAGVPQLFYRLQLP